MSILSVRHITTYRYRQPVAFGEHRMMLRPRESFDQRMIDWELIITPEPCDLRWAHDVFGNCIGFARFTGRADKLRFASSCTIDHTAQHALDFRMDEFAETYPFPYPAIESPDLLRWIERHTEDPVHDLDRWARSFIRRDGSTDTREMLTAMTLAIRADFAYVRREESGIQTPVDTLRKRSGSCRDFALLMMEAVRSLGLAARFVSGYLNTPQRGRERNVGGGATHAWAEIYLPGAGWIGHDPTNGIVGNRDLIRVAVSRDPAQASPIAGTWIGFPADSLGMEVEVYVDEITETSEKPPIIEPRRA